jgi:branched-chain amino acid transport system permease protein
MKRAGPAFSLLLPLMLLVLVLAAVPWLIGEYYVNLASQILIAAIFASSLNLLVGYGGLTSLGHAVYLGMSAYISAWLSLRMGLGHAVTAPAALILTTLVGCFFGWISLRASGLGFMMLTLALSQVVWGLGYRWVAVTNGDNGLSGLTRPVLFGLNLDGSSAFYWFVLAVTLVVLYAIYRFIHSPFGASLRGTRDQPRRMSALGFDVWAIRWFTFVASSFLGAVAGLLYVYFHKFIHPSLMSITVSAEALLSVLAGGAGTFAGPLVGAALVLILKNVASAYIERWNMLLGIVFVLIVTFVPAGLVPGILSLLKKVRGGKP